MASFCHKRVSTLGKVTGCSALGACAGTGGAPAAGVQALAQGPRPGTPWRGLSPHSRPVAVETSDHKRELVVRTESWTAWISLICLLQTQNI